MNGDEEMRLQNYRIVMTVGGGCPCQAQRRAIIELSDDISTAMPYISKVIKGCAYNPEANIMGFRMGNKSIIVYGHKIEI